MARTPGVDECICDALRNVDSGGTGRLDSATVMSFNVLICSVFSCSISFIAACAYQEHDTTCDDGVSIFAQKMMAQV